MNSETHTNEAAGIYIIPAPARVVIRKVYTQLPSYRYAAISTSSLEAGQTRETALFMMDVSFPLFGWRGLLG